MNENMTYVFRIARYFKFLATSSSTSTTCFEPNYKIAETFRESVKFKSRLICSDIKR